MIKYFGLKPIEESAEIDYCDINNQTKLKFIDLEGYKYFLNFGNLQNTYKKIKQGKNSHLAKFFCLNPYTKDNIQNFLNKRENGIILISKNMDNAHQKLTFYCKKHKQYFTNSWNVVSRGVGCDDCTKEKIEKNKKDKFLIKQKKFIPLLEKKHNISILTTEYNSIVQSVDFICKLHPNLIQTSSWRRLLNNGWCCKECEKEKAQKRYADNFFKRAYEVFGDEIEFLGEYINANTKILTLCKKCNNTFNATPKHLVCGHGCPKCTSSFGEKIIRDWFKENKVEYQDQYKIEGCKHHKSLSYDFYIPTKNILLEYQGIQHYQPVEIFGGEEAFKKQQINDQIKKSFAINNGYIFVEIKYNDNIELVLDLIFKTHRDLDEDERQFMDLDKLSNVFGGGEQ